MAKTTDFRVTIMFKEELVGDEEGSDHFYLRVTPVVKMVKKTDLQPLAREIGRQMGEEFRKKRNKK